MSGDRPTRDSMSLEEATVHNMWEIAAIVEVLERKGLCRKQDRYDLIAEFRRKNPRAKAEVCANTMAMARPIPEICCPTNRGERAGTGSRRDLSQRQEGSLFFTSLASPLSENTWPGLSLHDIAQKECYHRKRLRERSWTIE